jgi:hypothetical protein
MLRRSTSAFGDEPHQILEVIHVSANTMVPIFIENIKTLYQIATTMFAETFDNFLNSMRLIPEVV